MDTTTGISPSSVEALALRIFGGCRGVVYRQYPHLDAALAGLVPECAKETEIVGTDGLRLFFSGQKVLADYAACPQRMHRRYLHLLLHGLYLHVIGAKQYCGIVYRPQCSGRSGGRAAGRSVFQRLYLGLRVCGDSFLLQWLFLCLRKVGIIVFT